jgi:hypothetical protein
LLRFRDAKGNVVAEKLPGLDDGKTTASRGEATDTNGGITDDGISGDDGLSVGVIVDMKNLVFPIDYLLSEFRCVYWRVCGCTDHVGLGLWRERLIFCGL